MSPAEPPSRRSAPIVVVDRAAEGPAVADGVATRLRAAGYVVVDGFRPGSRAAGRAICRGRVATADDAAAALLAALAGHGLLVELACDVETGDRLVDDLRRLGPVESASAGPVPAGAAAISPEARAVLALIAEGLTLAEAAGAVGLSRRTADRRVAEARRALGTDRTTEAVARARALGWLDAAHGGGPRPAGARPAG